MSGMARRASLTRRAALLTAAAAAGLPARARAAPAMREIARGLRFPEGPVTLSDGGVLLVEIARGVLTRVRPDGATSVVAQLGGGPNGCAIGPDGAAYLTNNGGIAFRDEGGRLTVAGVPADYAGGSIQRVDLKTGAVRTLYREVAGNRLRGPNDIVMDGQGGFWFTDTGKLWPRSRDNGGLYWAALDGSEIREVAYPLLSPNGISLSPDRRTLYVVLSPQRQVLAYDVIGPGRVASEGGRPKPRVVASLGGLGLLDSMAVEAAGNLVVACVLRGALMVISPAGELLDDVPTPDLLPTAVAFGGRDMKTLYVTLANTGRLAAFDWPRPGLPLLYRL
jgi:gluconolactonase